MPEIQIELVNGKQPRTIYMPTSDEETNDLSIEITSDVDLQLTAQDPVPISSAYSEKGTLFYFELKELYLTDAEFLKLKPTLSDWKPALYSKGQLICLAPTKDQSLPANTVLVLKIGGFTAASAPGVAATIAGKFYRVPRVSANFHSASSEVSIQPPPSTDSDLHDLLNVEVSCSTVVRTIASQPPVRNEFKLVIAPKASSAPIVADGKTAFTVNFTYADDEFGYGALSTIQEAQGFKVSRQNGALAWTVVPPSPNSQTPEWRLEPGAGTVFGDRPVEFCFEDIITHFKPGATMMVVSYQNVPGYGNGAFWIVLNKEEHVEIKSFVATPNPVPLSAGKATVELSWDATSGSRLTLYPNGEDVSNSTGYRAEIKSETTFTLNAVGNGSSNSVSRKLNIQPFARIDSFTAAPNFVYHTDFGQDVLLNWKTTSDDHVTLTDHADHLSLDFHATEAFFKTVFGPRMFTVVPKHHLVGQPNQRHAIVSAFKLERQKIDTKGWMTNLKPALSPTANIGVVVQTLVPVDSDPLFNRLRVFDTITLDWYPSEIKTRYANVEGYEFSSDGRFLFVSSYTEPGPSMEGYLEIMAVDFNDKSRTYSFTAKDPVRMSGLPSLIHALGNKSTVFVSISPPAEARESSIDVVVHDGSKWSRRQTISYPGRTWGMASPPSGGRLFVLTGGAEAAIHVIEYDKVRGQYALSRTIRGFDPNDEPYSIAIGGHDYSTLLVPCKKSGIVRAIPTNAISVQSGQCLAVSSNPMDIIGVQDGTYCYVAHKKEVISLINCFKGAGNCRVVESDLSMPRSELINLIASADGRRIFVWAYGGEEKNGGLFVWNSVTTSIKAAFETASSCTSIAVGKTQVASWRDDTVRCGGEVAESPEPGVYVHDRGTSTATVQGRNTRFQAIRFWPEANRTLAVAVENDVNKLQILDAESFKVLATLELSPSMVKPPLAIAVTPFVNRAFVLIREEGGRVVLVELERTDNTSWFEIVDSIDILTVSSSSRQYLAAASDGSAVFISDESNAKLYVVSRNGKGAYVCEKQTYDFGKPPSHLVCSPDDAHLYAWMEKGNVVGFAKFDIAARKMTNAWLSSAGTTYKIGDLGISLDGDHLLATDYINRRLHIFLAGSLAYAGSYQLPGTPTAVAMAPDGSAAYLTCSKTSGHEVLIASQIPAKAKSASRTSPDPAASGPGINSPASSPIMGSE